MTEKQQRILEHALRLFAANGYNATSTAKIAKAAGVSEGLIFRHFTSKEGLLQAIIEEKSRQMANITTQMLNQTDPRQIIKAYIDNAFELPESEYPFWKLIYTLKWQNDVYDDAMSAPVKSALQNAYQSAGSSTPLADAEAVIMAIDGLALAILVRKIDVTPEIQQKFYTLFLPK